MYYLLDTNTCIAAVRNRPLVLQKMSAQSPEQCAIPTIARSYQDGGFLGGPL
jgi:predicted nucleic acid-binding protein